MLARTLTRASQLLSHYTFSGGSSLKKIASQTTHINNLSNLLVASSQNSFSSLASKPSSQLLIAPNHGLSPSTSILQRVCDAYFKSQMTQQQRTIVRISRLGKMKTVKMITQRFRRLGNGLWVRRQSAYSKRLYRDIFCGAGKRKILKGKRHVMCDLRQSRMLDKMVSNHWKRQKWYVNDPYKGYTDHSLFWYHPLDLPENSNKLPDDYYKYGPRKRRRREQAIKSMKSGNRFQNTSNRQKPVSQIPINL